MGSTEMPTKLFYGLKRDKQEHKVFIAIAEEIQGLQRIGKLCKFWASEFSSTLARSFSAL